MGNLTIRRTGADDYGRYIKALICGSPGAGKTLISSTFPHPFYASAEGGLMSIADRGIPYVEVRSSMDLLQFKHAVDQQPSVREGILGFPVETVVVDTIDEVQRILIRERLEETKKDAMSLPDWGWLGEQMQAIIRGFRNLDLNVVFTCHLRESQDNESGRVWFEPGLQGAIGKQIPAYVDLALLLKPVPVTKIVNNEAVRVLERTLITQPDSQHDWIKDRSGKLPAELPVDFNTDYERMHEAIYGDVKLPESAPITLESHTNLDVAPEPTPASNPPKTPEPVPVPEAATATTQPTIIPPDELPMPAPSAQPTAAEDEKRVCEECGEEVTRDQADLSRIRWRKVLCREHFIAEKEKVGRGRR
jgi:hypothetical protein